MYRLTKETYYVRNYNSEHGYKMDAMCGESHPNGTAKLYAHTTKRFDNCIICSINIVN